MARMLFKLGSSVIIGAVFLATTLSFSSTMASAMALGDGGVSEAGVQICDRGAIVGNCSKCETPECYICVMACYESQNYPDIYCKQLERAVRVSCCAGIKDGVVTPFDFCSSFSDHNGAVACNSKGARAYRECLAGFDFDIQEVLQSCFNECGDS